MPDRDSKEIRERVRYRLIRGVNDVATLCPDLVEDWDYKRNSKLPDDLTVTTNYMVNWVCHVCGHKWRSRLDSRTISNHGCPVCSRASGESIPDLLLYNILSNSLKGKAEVFYRYNAVSGCEADSYIADYRIAIEYNGYSYHSSKEKQEKDAIKKAKFEENGIKLYTFVERCDRDLYYTIDDDVVYMPEFSIEYFEFLKNALIASLISLGIISDVSEETRSLCVEDFKYRVNKPIYEKSLKYVLDNRTDIFLDEPNYLAEDIFATLTDNLHFKCKYGHKFISRVGHVSEGNGCPYCSGRRNGEYDSWEKAYNLALTFKDVREAGKSHLAELSGAREFACPYCGKKMKKVIPTRHTDVVSKFCDCTETLTDMNIYILGEDYDNRILYIAEVSGIYYFVVASSVENDLILSKVGDIVDDYMCYLDLELFKKYMGIPSIYKVNYNSFNTVPVTKECLQNFRLVSNFNTEELYLKLMEQKKNGISIKQVNKGKVIRFTKAMLIGYLIPKLTDYFGIKFTYNQTIGSFNTDLNSRVMGVSAMIKVNICNKKHYNNIANILQSTSRYIPIIITSYSEFSWSDRVIVIPESVWESDLPNVLEDLFYKLVSKFKEDTGYIAEDF